MHGVVGRVLDGVCCIVMSQVWLFSLLCLLLVITLLVTHGLGSAQSPVAGHCFGSSVERY